MENNVRMTLLCDAKFKGALKQIAKNNKQTLSDLVEELILRALDAEMREKRRIASKILR